MSRFMALMFAVIGVLLLSSIGVALSCQQLGLAALMTVVSAAFIGFGFVIKARKR